MKNYTVYQQLDEGLKPTRDLVQVLRTFDLEEVKEYCKDNEVHLITVETCDSDGIGLYIDNYVNYKKECNDTITDFLKGEIK